MIEEHERPHLANVVATPLRQGNKLKRKIKDSLSHHHQGSRSASNDRASDAQSTHTVGSTKSQSSKGSTDPMSHQKSTLASNTAVSAPHSPEADGVRDGGPGEHVNALQLDAKPELSKAGTPRGRPTSPATHGLGDTVLALEPSPISRTPSGQIVESQSRPNLVKTAGTPEVNRSSNSFTGSPQSLKSGSDATPVERKGDKISRQPSFFSSVMSVAQSAASQITAIGNNNVQEGSSQRTASSVPPELHRPRSYTEPASSAEPMANIKAAEPMGDGDLSMSHFGIDDGHNEKRSGQNGGERPRSVSRYRERRGSSAVSDKSPERSQSTPAHHISLPHRHKRGSDSPPAKGSTGLAIASNKRQKEFHGLFKSVPSTDSLIEDYGCALARDILLAGRMFVSEEHVCFNSNIFGWVTTLVVAFPEIVSIEKKSTAGIFPNALVISTLHSKHQFSSLIARDSTYELIVKIWKVQCTGVRGNDSSMRRSSTEFSSSDSDSSVSQDSDGSEFEDVNGGSENESLDSAKLKTAPAEAKSEGGEGNSKADVESSGPKEHGRTECKCLNSGEHLSQILDETIDGPIGRVMDIAYGKDKKWLENFLSDRENCTDVNVSDWKEERDSKQMREFNYVKPLNAPVGPKSTKCNITETIEHQDLESYVTITSSTSTPDVPSGGAFSVKMRTCLMWGENNTTRVIMGCNIEWTGKSWLKGTL